MSEQSDPTQADYEKKLVDTAKRYDTFLREKSATLCPQELAEFHRRFNYANSIVSKLVMIDIEKMRFSEEKKAERLSNRKFQDRALVFLAVVLLIVESISDGRDETGIIFIVWTVLWLSVLLFRKVEDSRSETIQRLEERVSDMYQCDLAGIGVSGSLTKKLVESRRRSSPWPEWGSAYELDSLQLDFELRKAILLPLLERSWTHDYPSRYEW